jgi:MFS family permease
VSATASLRRRFFGLLTLRWLGTGLVIPFFVLIMQERGLSLGEIGFAMAFYGVTVAILELPTGSFADSVGRRPTLLLAAAAMFAGEAAFLAANDMKVFVVAWGLLGVGRALDSGALNSWFVDAALAIDPEVDLRGALSGAGAIGSSALAIGALLGGALPVLLSAVGFEGAAGGLMVPLVGSLVVTLAYAAAIGAMVHEPTRRDEGSSLRDALAGIPGVLRLGGQTAVTNRIVRSLLMAMAVMGLAISSLETLWQPRFNQLLGGYKGNTLWFGVLGAAAFFGAALGSLAAPRLAKLLGGTGARTAFAAHVAVGVAIVVLGAVGTVPLAAALFTLAYVFVGVLGPLHEEMLHRQVSGSGRSTMLSLDSLAGQLGGIAGAAFAGVLAGSRGIPFTWTMVGVVTAVSGLLYLAVGHRERTPGADAIGSRPSAAAEVRAVSGRGQNRPIGDWSRGVSGNRFGAREPRRREPR